MRWQNQHQTMKKNWMKLTSLMRNLILDLSWFNKSLIILKVIQQMNLKQTKKCPIYSRSFQVLLKLSWQSSCTRMLFICTNFCRTEMKTFIPNISKSFKQRNWPKELTFQKLDILLIMFISLFTGLSLIKKPKDTLNQAKLWTMILFTKNNCPTAIWFATQTLQFSSMIRRRSSRYVNNSQISAKMYNCSSKKRRSTKSTIFSWISQSKVNKSEKL